jgi:CBS domain containing-hemolysin-like protein
VNVPLGQLGLLLFILCCAGFFSSSETAIFSLQGTDRRALKEDPALGETIRHLLARPRRLLAALLIGGELANTGMSAVSAAMILAAFPNKPWLNVILVGPILILFGDILPKTIALRFARTVARFNARPLNFWNEVVGVVRFPITVIVDFLLRALGVSPPSDVETVREEQLRSAIDEARRAGQLQEFEREIIHNVIDFGDVRVSRLMTPRPDIFSLSLGTPWSELLAALSANRYSRVPVWQGDPENVVGILLVKDLLRLRAGPAPTPRQLQKLLHPASFIPPGKRAQDLLREFRSRHFHLAIVVDEHGSCQGLITLDDLLGELVGEVLDEHDEQEKDATQVGPRAWSVRAGMDIDDFAERFQLDLPPGDWTTVAGLVFQLLGAMPKEGDEVAWQGLQFRVGAVDGRRIVEVTVSFPLPAAAAEPA